jgi:hypothetical protein
VALFERVFVALNAVGARYVIVGGVATVLHGFARLTADVDLVLDFEPEQASKAMRALSGLGLRPRAPVDAEQFADPIVREGWIRDKGMRVFSLCDPSEPMLEVDLFAAHPIPFDELFERSEVMTIGSASVHVASIPDLIALKRLAGRPEDLADIEALEAILERRTHGG